MSILFSKSTENNIEFFSPIKRKPSFNSHKAIQIPVPIGESSSENITVYVPRHRPNKLHKSPFTSSQVSPRLSSSSGLSSGLPLGLCSDNETYSYCEEVKTMELCNLYEGTFCKNTCNLCNTCSDTTSMCKVINDTNKGDYCKVSSDPNDNSITLLSECPLSCGTCEE